jgi:hypothetical protein
MWGRREKLEPEKALEKEKSENAPPTKIDTETEI